MTTALRRRGFTLVELMVACVIVVLLAATAVPSMRGDALRAARSDGVQALTRLQAAQERYRTAHGLYAVDLGTLGGVALVSEQGRYALHVENTGPESYTATALARGAQARDTACLALTLEVHQGFARPGPNPQCWNR
ncbi:MAG: prepilin-type N-terminal cleavage/methylation domain-containing protein [Rubrivivax sp.]|nr:prepilin-type N-terminal cleavage/methylation domain-containing protein [Rubrivivax sp.]